MFQPCGTQVIHKLFSLTAAQKKQKEKYLALGIKPDHDPNPQIDVIKATEDEDFDIDMDFNLIGEISVGIDVMNIIRQDYPRAYVIYYIERTLVAGGAPFWGAFLFL